MTLCIKPNASNFRHAGELASRFDTCDPRGPTFSDADVVIDLTDCDFVRPPAALWCVVYLALAAGRQTQSRLLVPRNMDVSEDVRRPGRSLLLHSGLGSLGITEELESAAKRTRLFPGTLAFLSIPA